MVTIVKGQWSVVTPVVTIAKGQWSHLWLQSLFSGVEHICACLTLTGELELSGRMLMGVSGLSQSCEQSVLVS